jgi:Flp pilus assembly secretin CpaC
MRRLEAALAVLIIAATPAMAQAAGRSVSVPLDQVTRLNLAGRAASVIVGNPSIADVTVVDERTLYVSGRGGGVTEIVVLDRTGAPIYEGDVVVTAPNDSQVSVWRGAQVTEMACAGVCSPVTRNGEAAAQQAAPAPAAPNP